MEEYDLSESDGEYDDISNLYSADPVFSNKEELSEFMASCNVEKSSQSSKSNGKDTICYETQKTIKKNCSCGNCGDIWSNDFEHICCHQIMRLVFSLLHFQLHLSRRMLYMITRLWYESLLNFFTQYIMNYICIYIKYI